MYWRHTIPGYTHPVFSLIKKGKKETYTLWSIDKKERTFVYFSFNEKGKFTAAKSTLLPDSCQIIFHDDSFLSVQCTEIALALSSKNYDGSTNWQKSMPLPRKYLWSIAKGQKNKVHLLYCECSPPQRAGLVTLDLKEENIQSEELHVPGFDINKTGLILDLQESVLFITERYGANPLAYIVDKDNVIRQSMPLPAYFHATCGVQLANGNIFLAGYHNEKGKEKLPSAALFKHDMSLLKMFYLPSTQFECCIKKLIIGPTGSIYALCPPWTIFCFDPTAKHLLGVAKLPKEMQEGVLNDCLLKDNDNWLLTGNFYENIGKTGKPSIWVARMPFAQLSFEAKEE